MPLHRAKDSVVSLIQRELEASKQSNKSSSSSNQNAKFNNNKNDDGSIDSVGSSRSSLISDLDIVEAKLNIIEDKFDGTPKHLIEQKKQKLLEEKKKKAGGVTGVGGGVPPRSPSTIYWQPYLTDWKDYEDILPIKLPKLVDSSKSRRSRRKRKDDYCFQLLKFCDPDLQEEDFFDSDDDDDEDSIDINDDDDVVHLREDSEMNIEVFENNIHSSMNEPEDNYGNGLVGIAKRTSVNVQLYLGVNKGKRISYRPKHSSSNSANNNNTNNNGQQQLRGGGGNKSRMFINKMHVHFAPFKSQIVIRPLCRINENEKQNMWWQFDDFEHFKAEITLLSQPSEEDEDACKHWLSAHSQNNNNNGNNDQHKQKQTKVTKTSQQSGFWWHKYGDSRRGIERIAYGTQSKEILEYYKVAIQHVLEEQNRQFSERHCTKKFVICGKRQCQLEATSADMESIARVYRQYTGWARDLALAAAASDEDAVKTNFDNSIRKTREYYILKQIYKQGLKVHKYTPQFMIPKNIHTKGYINEEECNQIIITNNGTTTTTDTSSKQQQPKPKSNNATTGTAAVGNKSSSSSSKNNNKENNNNETDDVAGAAKKETITAL